MDETDSYRFRGGESVAAGVERVYHDRVERALDTVDAAVDGNRDPDDAVHDVRVLGKELRALLSLAAGGLAEKQYESVTADVKAVGDALGTARDAAVGAALLDGLEGDVNEDALADARNGLERDEPTDAASVALESVRGDLTALLKTDFDLRELGFDVLRDGLTLVYRRGRKRRKRVLEEPTAERFHRWRVAAKAHGSQVRLVAGAWPGPLDARAEEVRRLGHLLGDAHDHAVLEARLDSHDPVAEALEVRRAEREAEALALGARVYAEKPTRFTGRIETYWTAWRPGDSA